MSPIITRNQTAVCLSPPFCTIHSIRSAGLRRNRFTTTMAVKDWISTFTQIPVACLLYSDCFYARCATGSRGHGTKAGQASLIDSVRCLGPILGSPNSCKRILRVEPSSHSPLLTDGFFGLDPLRRETWESPEEAESRRCDLEVSSFSAVDPVSSLRFVSVQSPHQHYIFIHTPPFLSCVR